MASYSKSVGRIVVGLSGRETPIDGPDTYSEKTYQTIEKVYRDAKLKGITPDFSGITGIGKFDKVEVTEIGGDLAIGISPIMDYSKIVPAGK